LIAVKVVLKRVFVLILLMGAAAVTIARNDKVASCIFVAKEYLLPVVPTFILFVTCVFFLMFSSRFGKRTVLLVL
jgi:hypothetical protein